VILFLTLLEYMKESFPLIECGMTAFLPSSFAMYMTMLGYAYYLRPSTNDRIGDRRVMMGTISFALGAILGWPFAALLGLPFVFEELFVKSGDEAVGEEAVFDWRVDRIGRLIKSVVFAAALAVSGCPFHCLRKPIGVTDKNMPYTRYPYSPLIHGHTANARSQPLISSSITSSPGKARNCTEPSLRVST
jgi:hypothetical protein